MATRVRPDETVTILPTVVDQRKELLRQEEHALEVDIVEAVQFRLSRLLEGVVM